ncbi:TetR family transcriptional regulator [Glycomyces luteolus]|uniref:TetR family transcriptional regulator n=1 Tax=Glycomyces luteolus TaxID=2670330 RepID=A0A9X3PBT5_9ACTN|nr:TetR/AcrR family transcriptional regulator [Glycomyces luteolus]MDA1360495.1 TetR family transcriptional regulator [Glycomyces luteolus]
MSSREQILEAALERLRAGASVSLASVADQVGLSKPGLMYHFPTKEALMVALIDHVLDTWERELTGLLDVPLEQADARQRHRAYLHWPFEAEFDQGDLVIFADPRLRPILTEHWARRMRPWIEIPADLPIERRARLTAARLIADGLWVDDALSLHSVEAEERQALLALADELLEEA